MIFLVCERQRQGQRCNVPIVKQEGQRDRDRGIDRQLCMRDRETETDRQTDRETETETEM